MEIGFSHRIGLIKVYRGFATERVIKRHGFSRGLQRFRRCGHLERVRLCGRLLWCCTRLDGLGRLRLFAFVPGRRSFLFYNDNRSIVLAGESAQSFRRGQ